MATLNSFITFTGRLGNVIAYTRNGRHYLRTCPERVRQTAGTRRSAQWFGAASRKGALIRSAITPDLGIHCDGSLVNRLNSAIVHAGRNNHAGLLGFRFNPYTDTRMFFSQPPGRFKDGKLHIPAQDLPVHGGATRMEVTVIATRIDFGNRRIIGTDASAVDIDLEQPFSGADLFVEVPGKGTLVITLQVRLFVGNEVLLNRKYKAADIVAVVENVAPKVQVAVHHAHPLCVVPSAMVPVIAGQVIVQRE